MDLRNGSMRIAHFSDLHYAPSTLEEADRCFSAAVDAAIAADVHAAVISGDITHHALEAHAPALYRFAAKLRRLADHCPVLLLQGTFTHEPPGTLSLFRLFGGRYQIHVADRLQHVALLSDGSWCESAGWGFETLPQKTLAALFTCIPTVNKAVVAAAVGAVVAAQEVGEQMARLLAGYGPSNRAARARGIPTIGVAHGTVNGCESEHGIPMVGLDHEFGISGLFSAETSAFMLGHIHKHQLWENEGRVIAYPGSIGRFHYGEQGEKGFLLWEVGAGWARPELVPTPARRMVDLAFAGLPDLEEIAAKAPGLSGAFVRVRWNAFEEERGAVDRKAIERLLCDAAGIKLEGRVVPLQRSRSAGIALETSLAAQVRIWAHAAGTDAGPLLECVESLERDTPEEIASRLLNGGSGSQICLTEPANSNVGTWPSGEYE